MKPVQTGLQTYVSSYSWQDQCICSYELYIVNLIISLQNILNFKQTRFHCVVF